MLIGINPSSQGYNRVGKYNEATACYDIAKRVQRIGKEQGLNIKIYWGGNQNTGSANLRCLRRALYDATSDGVKYFLSFHTDSAGNKRGYTGSLLLYLNNWGRLFGEKIAGIACERAGIPFYASRRRTNLMVLKNFQKIPCALIEIANHSDPDDLKLLLDPNWREKYAYGLVEGLLEYLGKSIQSKGEVEVSSFQAVPTATEVKIEGLHIWYDGLFTGKGDFGEGRVFMTIRMDEDKQIGAFKYAVIPRDLGRKIQWIPDKGWSHIKKHNRPVEVELPEDIGNFSLHVVVTRTSDRPRVSVNQMYK